MTLDKENLDKEESALAKFIGTKRMLQVLSAAKKESQVLATPSLKTLPVALAFLIALIPIALTCFDAFLSRPSSLFTPASFALATILALAMRHWLKLKSLKSIDWRQAFSLTHTAFALGCIPAILVLAFFPGSLAHKQEVVGTLFSPSESEMPALYIQLLFLAFIAAWAAITEELIFRGLLFSALRRWKAISSQKKRDIFAATISALLFGLGHYAVWGMGGALALTGVGVGFILAYLATGEKLMPLVIYHFLFDFVGLLIAVYVL